MARHAEALEMVKGELAPVSGRGHSFRVVDFSQWEKVREAAQEEVSRHGPVHVLINNTGGPPAGMAIESDPKAFLDAFSMHLASNQSLVQAVAPGMRESNYGRIINVISTSVVTPIRGLGVSNTIRGAVANWARTLAAELAPHGITVNNVLPGYTATARLEQLIRGRASRAGVTPAEVEADMKNSVPAKRFATAEEIASVIAFLASPAAAYVNGVNLPVDGGRLAVQ